MSRDQVLTRALESQASRLGKTKVREKETVKVRLVQDYKEQSGPNACRLESQANR